MPWAGSQHGLFSSRPGTNEERRQHEGVRPPLVLSEDEFIQASPLPPMSPQEASSTTCMWAPRNQSSASFMTCGSCQCPRSGLCLASPTIATVHSIENIHTAELDRVKSLGMGALMWKACYKFLCKLAEPLSMS